MRKLIEAEHEIHFFTCTDCNCELEAIQKYISLQTMFHRRREKKSIKGNKERRNEIESWCCWFGWIKKNVG